jgi:hypothetical protein
MIIAMLIYEIIIISYYVIYYNIMVNILMCYSNSTIVNIYWYYHKLVYKIIVNRSGYKITYFIVSYIVYSPYIYIYIYIYNARLLSVPTSNVLTAKLWTAATDIEFLDHCPSSMAAAAVLCATGETPSLESVSPGAAVSWCVGLAEVLLHTRTSMPLFTS